MRKVILFIGLFLFVGAVNVSANYYVYNKKGEFAGWVGSDKVFRFQGKVVGRVLDNGDLVSTDGTVLKKKYKDPGYTLSFDSRGNLYNVSGVDIGFANAQGQVGITNSGWIGVLTRDCVIYKPDGTAFTDKVDCQKFIDAVDALSEKLNAEGF